MGLLVAVERGRGCILAAQAGSKIHGMERHRRRWQNPVEYISFPQKNYEHFPRNVAEENRYTHKKKIIPPSAPILAASLFSYV
jgi:hypothetical protein